MNNKQKARNFLVSEFGACCIIAFGLFAPVTAMDSTIIVAAGVGIWLYCYLKPPPEVKK